METGLMVVPDRRDLVPLPIVDGLSGADVGLAAAQLVAAHSRRRSASRTRGRSRGRSRDSPEKQAPVLEAQADEVLALPVFSGFLETSVLSPARRHELELLSFRRELGSRDAMQQPKPSCSQAVCWRRYLLTSMHLSQMASAIGLLRKMEGELEKQRAWI